MTPTNELRFVERITEVNDADMALKYTQITNVLQQKWENTYWTVDESGSKFIEHEWRDVPIEKETDRG